MGTTIEDISSTKKRITIEIPTEIVSKEYKDFLSRMQQRSKIPGFRPGHAPLTLIEKKFGRDIKAEIIDKLVPEYYNKTLKEAELVPVAMPQIETALDIIKDQPLSFSMTVEVRPQIKDLAYAGLKVDDIEMKVEDSEVEEALTSLQEERALFEVVDREIKADDLIVVDYVKFDSDGEKELASAQDQVMNLGNKMTPPPMLEALTGRKKGDVIDITLPSFDDSGAVAQEGTGNRLRITVKEVKEKKLHALDDEFAKDFGHDTFDALRNRVREGIMEAKKANTSRQQKEKLMNQIVESHVFDVPESLLNQELENLITNEKMSRNPAGAAGAGDDPVKENDADDTALAEKLRPKAVHTIKSKILLDMIADREQVTVVKEELEAKIMLFARQLRATPDAVVNLFMTRDGSLDNLRNMVREEKVLDLILSKAEIVKGA